MQQITRLQLYRRISNTNFDFLVISSFITHALTKDESLSFSLADKINYHTNLDLILSNSIDPCITKNQGFRSKFGVLFVQAQSKLLGLIDSQILLERYKLSIAGLVNAKEAIQEVYESRSDGTLILSESIFNWLRKSLHEFKFGSFGSYQPGSCAQGLLIKDSGYIRVLSDANRQQKTKILGELDAYYIPENAGSYNLQLLNVLEDSSRLDHFSMVIGFRVKLNA